jgi:hypothetical protein
MTGTPTYHSWLNMKRRCLDPNHEHYPNYGGRGITFCERWKLFENFLADMGVRPEGMTLGRIKNSKGYYPLNCEWQTRQEQHSNKRTNHYLYHDGRIETMAEYARRLRLLKPKPAPARAVAKVGREEIRERILAGLARARKQGRVGGRPKAEDDHRLKAKVRHLHSGGASLRTIAAQTQIAVNTVRKILAAA